MGLIVFLVLFLFFSTTLMTSHDIYTYLYPLHLCLCSCFYCIFCLVLWLQLYLVIIRFSKYFQTSTSSSTWCKPWLLEISFNHTIPPHLDTQLRRKLNNQLNFSAQHLITSTDASFLHAHPYRTGAYSQQTNVDRHCQATPVIFEIHPPWHHSTPHLVKATSAIILVLYIPIGSSQGKGSYCLQCNPRN